MASLDDLWCDNCERSHEGLCHKLGALHKVQDSIIPSRARLTLPQSLTLKSIKENGVVRQGVFAKKTVPVRSLFGPLDAPVISKTKVASPADEATTVWKKKHAMQKAMETSGSSHTSANESSEMNNESTSPIISHIKSQQPQSKMMSSTRAADLAISSIQEQLMSITRESINQRVDAGILGFAPLQSTPIHGNHNSYSHLPQNLQDLPGINYQNGSHNLPIIHDQLTSTLEHMQGLGPNEIAAIHHNLHISDLSSANQMTPMGAADQSISSQHALQIDIQSAESTGVADSAHLNVSDSTDNQSENETDESQALDMTFEFKVLTDDGYTEVLDREDEENSNWMIFVQPASVLREQNLLAYQEDGHIFYVSLKPISPNTELRVWYSKDYATSIGKGMLQSEDVRSGKPLHCLQCEVRFNDPSDMENHFCIGKTKTRRKGRPRKYVKPTKTWRAKLEKSRAKESQQDVKQLKTADIENTSAQKMITQTPKRGRGRPRVKPLVLQSEKERKTQKRKEEKPIVYPSRIEIHETVKPSQPELISQQNHEEVFVNAYDDVEDNGIDMDSYHGVEEDDDDDDDNEDPAYEKSLVVDEKEKRKRGPKLTKSPMSCPHCPAQFNAEAAFHVHVYEHTGVKPFICEIVLCGRGFLSKFKLERHRLIHTSPRHHKCPYCDKSFNRKDHLKNHMVTHDPNKRMWTCELCDKKYCYVFSYRTHMAIHRAERGETLSCGICEKKFENKEQLLFHLKVHTGARAAKNTTEKTHSCQECGKKFFTLKDVKRHMITHTKRKDFLCQHCPQRFGRKDHLTRHLRTSHTNDKDSTSPTGRQRRSTGESSNSSPSKRKERQVFAANVEPTMVPLQMSITGLPQEDLTDQLVNGVLPAAQISSNAITPALIQNLQYAVSQLQGQIPATFYEAAAQAAASAQEQQQQQQQQHQQQQQQQHQQLQITPIHAVPASAGMQTVQTSLPLQYKINDEGYVVSAQQPEQTIVRQIQLSPNMDYKHFTQSLQGNMYITSANPQSLHQNHQQQAATPTQPTQTLQQPTIQHITHVPQSHQQTQHIQTLLPASKIEMPEISHTSHVVTMQQPPEYQISVSSGLDQTRASLVEAKSAPISQFSNLLGYMETIRFLENLPTNNSNTYSFPMQQLQAVNVEVSQGQFIPTGSGNTAQASAANVININQADLVKGTINLNQTDFSKGTLSINQVDLPKGMVTISHPHGAVLTAQDLKTVVSLAQSGTPLQQVTYQQQ
ncbi:PR domain zinc finger protein 10-like [Mya arenaria]|uniref:PR domain zinc finger protein 10-like n=1 Tax=Mya arenaria TaxID=6604 RepID=UPI0022E8F6DC|nr:PR domain zinc finger protein 10-like [Mya arenaria]XP_052776986.1 PR domain zinc finger protein 10-like [Mya arenaria]XP_052776987.1 PR domain zinc finger protein 10-like [Mya arenaria]XP_052776988.1 PR domain zinc finger protein 10-like [Mya arenaria]